MNLKNKVFHEIHTKIFDYVFKKEFNIIELHLWHKMYNQVTRQIDDLITDHVHDFIASQFIASQFLHLEYDTELVSGEKSYESS